MWTQWPLLDWLKILCLVLHLPYFHTTFMHRWREPSPWKKTKSVSLSGCNSCWAKMSPEGIDRSLCLLRRTDRRAGEWVGGVETTNILLLTTAKLIITLKMGLYVFVCVFAHIHVCRNKYVQAILQSQIVCWKYLQVWYFLTCQQWRNLQFLSPTHSLVHIHTQTPGARAGSYSSLRKPQLGKPLS